MDSKTTVRYTVQYFEDGWDMTGQPYASIGADEIRAWDGDSVIVALKRTPDGKWRIEASDGTIPEDMWYDSYVDLGSVLSYLGMEWNVDFVREDWCTATIQNIHVRGIQTGCGNGTDTAGSA